MLILLSECLNGVFQQLANPADGEEASVREKTCKFISSKLATFGNDELSAETEKYIVMTVKKVRPLTEHSFFPLGYLLAN